MTQDERKTIMYTQGRADALALQETAPSMTGTQLYAAEGKIPSFRAAAANANMLSRHAGFVCRSAAGRVVRLVQPYDSAIYTQEPEKLPTQWGFVWSTDPAHALPFISLATSPYMAGDCCWEGETVYRSLVDNNVFAPSAYPAGWEAVSA